MDDHVNVGPHGREDKDDELQPNVIQSGARQFKPFVNDLEARQEIPYELECPRAVGWSAKKLELGKPERLAVYRNPETNEIVQTLNNRNDLLKMWKKKYGEKKVESWRVL